MPQTLNAFISIKNEEIKQATQSPLSAINMKKGRSPQKGSKGHKLLVSREKELAADRRLKRFNLVTLVDTLHEMLNGIKQQDDLVDQVKQALHRYKEALKMSSGGLMHLLTKWGVIVDSSRSKNAIVAAID